MAVQHGNITESESLIQLLQPIWVKVKSGLESLQQFSTAFQSPSTPAKYLQVLSNQAYDSINEAQKDLEQIKEHKQTETYQCLKQRQDIEKKIIKCEAKLVYLKNSQLRKTQDVESKRKDVSIKKNEIFEQEQKLNRLRGEYESKVAGGILLNGATGIFSIVAVGVTGGLAAPVVIPAQLGLAKATYDVIVEVEEDLKRSRRELSLHRTQLEYYEADLQRITLEIKSLQKDDENNREMLSKLKNHLDMILEELKTVTKLCGCMSQICSFLQISRSRFELLKEKNKEHVFKAHLNLILAQIINLFSSPDHMNLVENTPLVLMIKDLKSAIADLTSSDNTGEKYLDYI